MLDFVKVKESVIVYGPIEWPEDSDPLQVEMEYIRAGGYITLEGQRSGEGLFYHYKRAQQLLWPEGEDHHRWSDLMLREILANRITCVSGARDAGKTYVMSRYALTDYFCFPEDTLILMTSTDIRGLQLRVWGTIKDLFNKAKEIHPWLPGNVVESLHGIFTDKLTEDTPVRDLRRGIIGIPIMDRKGAWTGGLQRFCFPSGTIVDTPTGGIPIEQLRVGDSVCSAIGISKVSGTITRTAEMLVRLHLSSGEHIDCTANHRLLTGVGWKAAIDILPQTTLISTHESVQIMRKSVHSKIEHQQVLLQCLQGQGSRTTEEGFGSEQVYGRKRVVRVEILEPSGDKRFNKSSGGYRVHNIEVEGHPSYSVNGCLVHNCGIKQRRRRLLGDEVQFAHSEYLTVLSNLDKGDFKGVFVGNALANFKALDKISEPIEGWGNHPDPTKTEVFKNRYGGNTITLVGTDSPNYDQPADQPDKYPYLVSRTDEKSVGDRYGRNSEQYYSQIAGYRKPGLFAHRVLTQEMCERYHAFKDVVWQGEETTKVYACDMGFGGDRAVAGWGEFGRDVNGSIVVRVQEPSVIPLSADTEAEDQIALYVRKECLALGIPGANVFYDAGMRATAAVAMSKLFSTEANAVNFGGSPTKRPVSASEYVIDQQTGAKRLKRCDEHYIKFVTELWFSVRLTVMARQLRGLPRDVAEEFYLREWTLEKGNRYELEKKEDTKDRTGVSPDLGDWLAILIEGARRLGFMIENLPEQEGAAKIDDDYLEREVRRYRADVNRRQLHYD